MRSRSRSAFAALAIACAASPVLAQAPAAPPAAPALDSLVFRLATMSAVTGFEDAMAESLLAALPGASLDRAGNVVWTRGSGDPVRVAVCPMDEVGYVVGSLTPDGYLTLRRVGATPMGPLFDQFLEGQRVTVFGRRGAVPGVVGVRSTHLTRGRPSAGEEPFALDNAYVDIGATNAAGARALGIEVLAPVTRTKRAHRYGEDLVAAPEAAARAACAALLAAAQRPPAPGAHGTVIAAFTRRRHFRWDGASFLLMERARGAAASDVVILGQTARADSLGAGAASASRDSISVAGGFQAATAWALPARYARTPVETVSLTDVAALSERLRWFLGGEAAAAAGRTDSGAGSRRAAGQALRPSPRLAPLGAGAATEATSRISEARDIVSQLVATYGVSGHEAPVREAVIRLLPAWASPTIDSAGNVLVRAGAGDPLVVFVAHLDEIGFTVTAIRDDGKIELRTIGGFFPSLFEAEPALVHTASGMVPAVLAPRDSVGAAPRRNPGALRVDPGAVSKAGTEALGIRVGDVVTMPKEYVDLAGHRATARSFDDRVGCAAQILALRRLDPRRLRHAVLFIFSTREETGLEGARFAAERLAGEHPVRVHAIDTFVSADAPLEIKTFADAPLGGGAVVRAVDNSSVTPPALVDSLLALARTRRIPLAAGTTNGGNDGSTFTRFGVPDIGLGWPLRYAHSPAEVIDLADLVALGDIIQLVAERW